MLIRTLTWSIARSTTKSGTINPSIQIFGVADHPYNSLSTYKTTYVRVPAINTYILKFGDTVTAQQIENLRSYFNPENIQVSHYNSDIIIVRGSIFKDKVNQVPWIEMKMDPYGLLASFWQYNKIVPYGNMYIEKYKNIGTYAITDINLQTSESMIHQYRQHLTKPVVTNLFWDIEVWSHDMESFPSADNIHNYVFMISMVRQRGNEISTYLLVLGDIDRREITTNKSVNIIRVKSETELIQQFFSSISQLSIDRLISFNGETFDMPYMLRRSQVLKFQIPNSSKIANLQSSIYTKHINGLFGPQDVLSINLPGIEQIDMLNFFRKYYPGLVNYRLDTLGLMFLGRGKTGLSVRTMMEYVQSRDPKKMGIVGEYSVQDSLLLYDLWNNLNLDTKIEHMANVLLATIEDVISLSEHALVDRLAYAIDPGTVFSKESTAFPTHLKTPKSGIYKNVYVYDYSDLYRSLMKSGEILSIILANKLSDLSPVFSEIAYYSKYVNREELDPILNQLISNITESYTVIQIDKWKIYTMEPIDLSGLDLVSIYSHYIIINHSNYIIKTSDGIEHTFGRNKIIKPPFAAAQHLIDEYLNYVYDNVHEKPPKPLISTPYTFDELVQQSKIKGSDSYQKETFRSILAQQYNNPIDTWVQVHWVQTTTGPKLISLFDPDVDTIDIKFYIKELNSIYSTLEKLPIYYGNI